MRPATARGLLAAVALLGCGRPPAPPLPPGPRIVYDPGTLVWAGNVVRAGRSDRLLQIVQLLVDEHYAIAVLESRDGGATWSAPRLIVRTPGSSFYDPMVLRFRNGGLLLGTHSNGALHFFRSSDGGREWSPQGELRPPSGSTYAEVFMRELEDRLLLCYARIEVPAEVASYELRTSADGGRTWSDPLHLGDGGRFSDGIRAAVGPQDATGSLLAAYSFRPSPTGSVEVRAALLTADPLRVATDPFTVTTIEGVGRNVGAFPVPVLCGGRHAVMLTAWIPQGRSTIQLVPVASGTETALIESPALSIERDSVGNGFGRVWPFVGPDDSLHVAFVESPDNTRSRIVQMPVPDAGRCRA